MCEKLSIVFFALATSMVCMCEELPDFTKNRDVEKLFPEEYKQAREALAKNDDDKAASALLKLTSKAKSNLEDAARAYQGAWMVALAVAKNTKSSEVKTKILKTWDDAISDGPFLAWQMNALQFVWDRDFLTNKFWSTFKSTIQIRAINVICITIARHGNEGDEARVREKMESTADNSIRDQMQNALNWMKYWRNHAPGDPGPNSLLPPGP